MLLLLLNTKTSLCDSGTAHSLARLQLLWHISVMADISMLSDQTCLRDSCALSTEEKLVGKKNQCIPFCWAFDTLTLPFDDKLLALEIPSRREMQRLLIASWELQPKDQNTADFVFNHDDLSADNLRWCDRNMDETIQEWLNDPAQSRNPGEADSRQKVNDGNQPCLSGGAWAVPKGQRNSKQTNLANEGAEQQS